MIMKLSTFLLLCGLAGIFAIPACQTVTPAQKTAAIQTVEKAVAAIASDYAANGKLNEASAIATGLNAISAVVSQTSTNAEAQALVSAAVTEYTGDTSPSGKTTAQRIASAVASGLEEAASPPAKQATVVAAGVAASNAVQTVATASSDSSK